MARFTDLPTELLDLIGALLGNDRYAQRATLRSLILTCQSFQHQFTPQLWANIEVATGSKRRQPDAIVIKSHAQLIHTLKYYGSLPVEYYDISFPNLVGVDCREWLDTKKPSTEQWDSNWSRLVRLNPTIRDIHIGAGNPTGYNEIWETIVVSLENPRRLGVGGTDMGAVPGPGRKAFWKACARFEEIDYRGVDQTNFQDNRFIYDLDFSRLTRLRCSLFSGSLYPADLLNWMATCSNLTQLHLGYDSGTTPAQDFIALAKLSVWPMLEDLSLRSVQGSDEQFAVVLRHLPPLKLMTRWRAWFGPASFKVLRERYFDNLRSLDVLASWGFKSPMALDVLQSCPQLEEYSARRISLKDLRSSPQPWACLRLKSLTVFFASDPDELGDNTLFFDQLSKLTRLEELDVSLIYDQDTNGQKI
ncbi:hypothetical protein BGX29_003173, partial [Mortierella sp. GBA35]